MFLVDTNIVSELRRQRPHKAVLAWIDSIDRRMLFISAVSIGEIQAGIEITRRQDLAKAAEIEAWLEMIEGSWQILGMDGSSFRHWARLMHGQSEALYEDAPPFGGAVAERLRASGAALPSSFPPFQR